jgi:hypothetical protein
MWFKDFLLSYPFLYQFTASGAEGSREGRTNTVPLETGKAKFKEFLHGKGSYLSVIIWLLCQSNVFIDTISIGEPTQKIECDS